MRILAIRGSNLASLAGHFELDLSRSPLREARLFVITGPVGAGKSTLLDALSVALFHRAPRFLEAGSAKWDDLSPDDARNLLRRGTTEGFAEVDFQADDAGSYRARWEVRRARRRVEGAIQKASCSLSCLQSGKLLGTGLKETESEIRRLLGLDFSQFQRAVLLSQGEFASFLKANSDQRSALLEQMTGTELYGQVSKAAYQRAKLESDRAESLQREMNALHPIDPEEVAGLQIRLQETNKGLTELEELLRALRREKEWFTQEEELKLDLERAESEQVEVLAQEATFNDKKEELRLTETALSLASWLSVIDELKGQAGVLNLGLDTQKDAASQAGERRDAAQRAVEHARMALEAALIPRRESEQLIEEAIKLDEQLKLANHALVQAENRYREANERKATAERNVGLSRNRLSELKATNQELEKVRTLSREPAKLFAEQKYWLEQILQYEKLKEDEVKNGTNLAGLALTVADLRKKEEGVSSELSTENSEIERLEAASASLEAEIAALGPDKLASQQEELLTLQERAAGLEKSNIELRALVSEAQRLVSERKEAVRESSTARSLAAEMDSSLPALEAAAAEAERAWRTALSCRKPNIETLRSELLPGAPCPVCGALDHPWISVDAPVLDELVEKSGKRRDALAAELAVLRGRRAQQETRLAQLQACIRETDKRLSSLIPLRDRLQKTLDEGAGRLGLADPRAASQALAASKSRLEAVTKELRVVHDKEAVLRSTQQQLRSRRRVFEKHRALHSKLQTDLGVASSREESLTALLSVRAETREKLGSRISAALACLPDLAPPAFPGPDPSRPQSGRTLPLLENNPEALRRTFASRADEWKNKLEQLEETRRLISAVEAEIECRERETAQTVAGCAEAEADFLAREREAIELAHRRSLLLDGRSAAEVRRDLDEQVEKHRQVRRSAERKLQAANAELLRLETIIGSKTDHMEINSERLAAKQATLERKLRKRGLMEDDARRLASRGESWCEETRKALNDYENQRVRARERIKERARQLRAHERTRPRRGSQDLEHLLEETIERRTTLDCSQGEIRARLIHAQSVADRIKVLSEQLVSLEEEGRIWIELGEVIGSPDGKAFRNLAQTYTLDLLLDRANLHLAEMKPRYRLERFRDDSHEPFGILIVDQDMGDERRPVTTLSGGETFLVSLALALGLSSLQSQRVRLGSLFIDEGFGALDSTALQTALAALEALQLQDRQIGIISHIEGLAEHFPTEVRVVPVGSGTSRLEVKRT